MTWRLLKALAWLRWRLLVNGLASARRRGGVEHASRWIEVAVPAVLALLLLPVSLGLAGVGAASGWLLAARSADPGTVGALATLILSVPLAWMVVRPLVAAFSGASETETQLRLLPIPAGLLARLALVQEVADPAFLVFAPAVLLLPVGAIAGGNAALAAAAAAAGLALLGVLAALGALVTLGFRLVLRDRRRGELVALLLFTVFAIAGVLPQLLHARRGPPPTARPGVPPAAARRDSPEVRVSGVPVALRVSPPGLYGGTLAAASRGAWSGAAVRTLVLALLALGGLAAVAPLSRVLAETPERTSRTGRARAPRAGGVRLPLVSPATAAVASVAVRATGRTVRGRMVLLVPPVLVAAPNGTGTAEPPVLVAALTLAWTRGSAVPVPLGAAPLVLAGLAVLMTLGNVAVFTCNQFGTSGSGLVLEFLQPLSEVALVRGRALAFAGFSALALALALAPLLVLGAHVALATLLAAYLGGVSVQVALSPLAVAVSALLPKPVDLGRIGRAGQPNAGASLAHMLAAGLAALPVAGLLALALAVWRTPWLAPLLVGGWLLCTIGAAALLLPLAARLVAARRENLALLAMER